MPLLSKRIFNCVKPLSDVRPDEKIYTIPHTKEQLRSQEEYEKRLQLYKKRIWTCQSTGHVNLTHEEAWNSEKAVLKTLKEQFAPCYDKPVLELVHHSTKSLDTLVDEAWLVLQQVLVVGERVLLKVKSGGKSMKAVIVKVDPAGYELLPYKYSIRFENEDSVIHSVPANDLSRGDKPPSKELLRLFIRTYAVRAGHTPNSPWIVDDAQVKKLDLQSKFASFLLSPVKWKADEIAKKIDEEIKSIKSASKASPRIKTKMDAKEEKRKEKAKKSISKMEKKSEKLKQQKEKQAKKNEVTELDSSDDSSGEESENEDNKDAVIVSDSDADSDTPLSVVKTQLTPKKKSSDSSSEKLEKVKKKKAVSLADLQKQLKSKNKEGKLKKPLTLADLKKQMEKKKNKKLDKEKKKSKKGQDPKQMTLLDSLKKKGLKTPEKKMKSLSKQNSPLKMQKTPDMKKKLMSPPRTPIVVQKLQQAIKKEDKSLIGLYSTQAAKVLTNGQREKLGSEVKELVMKKYNLLQEKLKLSKMTEEEKKAYLEKRAQQRREEYRKKLKHSRKKFEDTCLDLKALPPPKLVVTPDGLPNELFGDVTMVTEFISCYSGLLMPDDEYPIYTEALMKALAAGKDGFTYLCRTLTVLLQTLLQDQIAEDYEELKVPLSDIPVNPCTCSELVRLCLRRQDVTDDKSDTSYNSDEVGEGEVPDDLIQLLETQELYQLEAEQKLAILKGLCERIMGTYSVQDYMEEKQQESAGLWRQQIAKWKEEKASQQAKKAEEKQKKENDKEVQDDKKKAKPEKEKEKDAPTNNTLLTQFYGKKDEDGQTSGDNSETPMDVEDDDVISKIKRRRLTAAQALEERRKKDLEDKIRREKEQEILRQQKEKEQFEKDFNEGVLLAKITQRQTPVGTDRNHSRYWVFCDVTPGVFVEKGWVGEEIEYTCKKDTDDDIESSSSSEDEDEAEGEEGTNAAGTHKKNKPPKVVKCVDTTFPHVGQNLWFTYDKQSAVNDLIDALHPQGSRESVLKRELVKRQADITKAIYRQQRSNLELRDCDGDKEMIESLKKELLETELRLRNGGLGGVDDFPTWNTKLETAVDVSTLGDCLLECQENVLEKFRDGIMVIKKKKNAAVKEEDEEEEEEKLEAPGIQHWREAVKSCGTLSRLHVLLGILDSCIKWEKSAENAKCKICRKKGQEDKLLLCDDCNQAFHIYCLRPALPCVPKGDWKCIGCAPLARKRVIDVPGKYHEDSEDDEEIKEAKTKSIKHDETCLECGGDESLILCAECPSAYHLECHDPPLRHPPRGRWVCNDCKNGVKRRTRRGAVNQDARKRGRPAAKRKRYVESSEEESSGEETEGNDNDEDEETEDEDSKPPPRKAARTSKGRAGRPPGRKPKNAKSESPRNEVGRPKGRRSAPSPEPVYETKPKVSRRAPSELSLIEDIINKMLDFKSAWPFWHNVSKRDVPDYYDIIKQPISFQKIKDKLNCLVYGSPQEVIDDVALVFRNAVEYNKVGSEVYDCIDLSEKYFVDLMKKYLPFYAYNRDCKSNGYGDHMYSDEGRKSRKSK
ncbi:tyrosine-protein kinase BAZ1B-like isoform X2 [Mercenaria mercenaria]|uniref:tyrosine-protein kinase BAZ1B-like isoform X2 n=1 Tax=Mercenaria mercenaria TaxID=6596 RepID=UPI00234F5E43|nr:tyrosine-protein kinase BAZ1B-like isoform X2 [Mercenaria mercenaria]